MHTWSSRFGNGTKVLDQVFLGHTDTSVTNRKDPILLIQLNLQFKIINKFNKQQTTQSSTNIFSSLHANYLDFKLGIVTLTEDLLIRQGKEPELVQCLYNTNKYVKFTNHKSRERDADI